MPNDDRNQTGRCPICAEPRAARGENRYFPFCSERCKWVDLGRWMGEAYVISEPLIPAGAGELAESGPETEQGPSSNARDRQRLH